MFRTVLIIVLAFFAASFSASDARAHCQIPCGIFDDKRTFAELYEHADTIERSVRGYNEASSVHDQARWVNNKEEHATKIQTVASEYFLAQRVKPVEKGTKGYQDYQTSTELLHRLIVAAMRSRQKMDDATIQALRAAIKAYEVHYWAQHGHEH
jgi:nickel superoxide dismutase